MPAPPKTRAVLSNVARELARVIQSRAEFDDYSECHRCTSVPHRWPKAFQPRTAMPRDFFPRPDADAVTWTANLSQRINDDPGAYHVSPEEAAGYSDLAAAFAAA